MGQYEKPLYQGLLLGQNLSLIGINRNDILNACCFRRYQEAGISKVHGPGGIGDCIPAASPIAFARIRKLLCLRDYFLNGCDGSVNLFFCVIGCQSDAYQSTNCFQTQYIVDQFFGIIMTMPDAYALLA